ncbi:MAG: ArnT family glycosyltransferase [Bacteroidia bacterium]
MSKVQKKPAQTISPASAVYSKLNKYLVSNHSKLLWLIIGVGAVLSFINFNARVSEAHDDSLYIEAAYRYIHEFPNYYYTANAPMYPMFLALLTYFFGTNLIVFKLFSVLFFIIGAILYYKALDKRVPELLKYFVLIFICTNHLILYYSSQTFSEAFYMLIQATFFYYFCKYNFGENPVSTNIKVDLKKWLVLGLLMMLLTLAKNILIFGIVAIVLFYAWRKEYKKAVISLMSFGIFKLLYEVIKNLIWGDSAIQYKSQMGILLNKDPYDASKGQEDIAGFIGRFTDNIGLYLGKRFYQILGFLDENYTGSKYVEVNGEMVAETSKGIYIFAFIVLFLTFYGLYRAVKDKQHVVTFFILFAGTVSFGTFLLLQARWDQPRFIMVHMPALLLGIGYGLYRYFEKSNFNQRIFLLLLFIITGSLLISSTKRGLKNIPVVTKNLKGDIYYGYTPDWKNYLQMSAYCADSLPKNSFVACRKAPMSFVYARGRHFYPIYNVIAKDPATNQSNPDSALAIFRKNNVTHLLIASLRIDPSKNTGDIINTMHNIAAPIVQKYPAKLQLVKTIGDTEPAYLYEIKY